MRKFLQIAAIIVILTVLFRGPLYRLLINYEEIGSRFSTPIKNPDLSKKIADLATQEPKTMPEIVAAAQAVTTEILCFELGKASADPNELIRTQKANCIGYAAMFNSVAQHLITANGLEKQIASRHLVGKLDFLGIDLHQFSSSAFFRDHDFNEVRNLRTGQIISIDATVSDYFWINEVSASR